MQHKASLGMLGLLGVALGGTLAAADRPPQPPWFGSGEGRQMYDVAAAVALECPRKDTAAQRARLDAYAEKAAKATKPDVRAEFTAYADKLRAWFDKHLAGVPGVGTWAELDGFYKQAYDAEWALPRQASEEEIQKNFKAYVASAVNADRLWQVVQAIRGDSACPDEATRFEALHREVHGTRQMVDRKTRDVWATLDSAWQAWRANRPADVAPPKTYWEHVAWVKERVDDLAATAALRAKIADFAAWSARSAETDVLFAEALPALQSALTSADAIAAELAKVEMPPIPRDTKRRALVAEKVTDAHGRTIVSDVYANPKTSKKKWTEKVVVRTTETKVYYRNVPYEREWFTAYYAWKPEGDKLTAPDLPGVARTEICELWSQNVAKMNKGDPSLKRWYAWESWREGYLPCANTGKVSKLKKK